MHDSPQQPAPHERRALIADRLRFTFRLSLVVSLCYTLLMLAMAFAPGWLAIPLWPGSGISTGLLASFLYTLLSLAGMRIWLRRRTSDARSWGIGREIPRRDP